MPARSVKFPEHMLAPATAEDLGLLRKKDYVVLRCENEARETCTSCVMPLVRRAALKHRHRESLPSCPAHKQGEAGWVHLEQCLVQLGLTACIVHQLPVYSEEHQGRLRNGQLCTQATLKVDVMLPTKHSDKYIGVGLELNGREHTKRQARHQDGRRICAAIQQGRVLVESLWLGEEQYWLQDIADVWMCAHANKAAPETC